MLPSASATFGQAWEIYKKRWGTLTGIVLIPLIILTVASSLLGVVSALVIVSGMVSYSSLLLPLLLPILIVLVVFLILIVQSWGQTALIYAIKDREENIGVIESYRRAWKKVFSYLWVIILSGLVMAGGMILLVVPGIIFMVWLSLAMIIVVVEDQKGMNALLVSREYVRGNWGGVLWRLVFIGLCSAIVSFGVSFLVAAVLKVVAIPYLSTIISALVSVFVTSIAVTYNYSLYSNLKSLKGGAVVVPEKNDKKVMIFVAILGLVVFPGVLIANIYFVSRVTSNRAINYQPSQGSISYPVGHY